MNRLSGSNCLKGGLGRIFLPIRPIERLRGYKDDIIMDIFSFCKRSCLLLLPIFGILSGPSQSFAGCVMGGDEKVEIFLTPEKGAWGNFSGKTEFAPSSITRCREDSNKYLMLTLGVSRPGKEANLRDVYVFDNYQPEVCELKNSLSMKRISLEGDHENFNQQFKLLRSCFELKVDDINGETISFNEKQTYCKVRKTSDGGVFLSGDMCFLKISNRNQFSVLPVLKNECRDSKYLQNLGLMAQDLEANLDIFVAGDDSGNSMDLTQLGSRPILLNVTPLSNLLPLSEDFGPEMPRFSTNYNVNVDWGRVSIRPGPKSTQIRVSVLASNLSEKVCKGDICIRNSNFVQPVFGQIEVFELKANRKPLLIEEWWDGGFASPNWQGIIPGIGYAVDSELFSPGKKYRIQVTFQNPTDDYAIYLSGLSQMLINLNTVNNGVVGIDTIPGLETLRQLGVFPKFMGTAILRGNDQGVDLSETIRGLSGIIANRVWPTYFENICDDAKSSCLKLGKEKFYQRLVMEFTAGDTDISTGEMSLEGASLQKLSNIFNSYDLATRTMPEFSCGD